MIIMSQIQLKTLCVSADVCIITGFKIYNCKITNVLYLYIYKFTHTYTHTHTHTRVRTTICDELTK